MHHIPLPPKVLVFRNIHKPMPDVARIHSSGEPATIRSGWVPGATGGPGLEGALAALESGVLDLNYRTSPHYGPR